jgi:hypothetical protein
MGIATVKASGTQRYSGHYCKIGGRARWDQESRSVTSWNWERVVVLLLLKR